LASEPVNIWRHGCCDSFGMSSITAEAGSDGQSGALFEELTLPADSSAVVTRGMLRGALRLQSAVRNQVELRACDLDASVSADHQARAVWAFVQSVDLRAQYAQVRAIEGGVGRAPSDPAILMSLWLYAVLDGMGWARALDRRCDCDDAANPVVQRAPAGQKWKSTAPRVSVIRSRGSPARATRCSRRVPTPPGTGPRGCAWPT
jgi:hypothetical protein